MLSVPVQHPQRILQFGSPLTQHWSLRRNNLVREHSRRVTQTNLVVVLQWRPVLRTSILASVPRIGSAPLEVR